MAIKYVRYRVCIRRTIVCIPVPCSSPTCILHSTLYTLSYTPYVLCTVCIQVRVQYVLVCHTVHCMFIRVPWSADVIWYSTEYDKYVVGYFYYDSTSLLLVGPGAAVQCIVLYCTVLYCTVLYCTLYCTCSTTLRRWRSLAKTGWFVFWEMDAGILTCRFRNI
jgi:hypothetical protein